MSDSNQNNATSNDLLTWLNRNVIVIGKFRGIPKRNIVEAIIFGLIVAFIILIINFTQIVTTISILVLCTVTVLLTVKGIKNRSVTQILISEIKFHRNRRMLHLRGPEYVRNENKYSAEEREGESAFETLVRIFKDKIYDFVDKYSEEEAGK